MNFVLEIAHFVHSNLRQKFPVAKSDGEGALASDPPVVTIGLVT